jgi:hypothetical protein
MPGAVPVAHFTFFLAEVHERVHESFDWQRRQGIDTQGFDRAGDGGRLALSSDRGGLGNWRWWGRGFFSRHCMRRFSTDCE